MGTGNDSSAHAILFGLNRVEDERSLAIFLRLFARRELTDVLVPRMTDAEIRQTVDLLTTIMRNHLSKKEYHALFLDGDGR
jgi:hypothetical protein